jgi:small subunit ribosomal protein S11
MAKKTDTIKETAEEVKAAPAAVAPESQAAGKAPKKKINSGVLHIEATFNNTKVVFSDKGGNTLFWSSAGHQGFKGAKKGTPFAASKVGDVLGEKAQALGIKDADVVVSGVGPGREGAIRAFMSRGIEITSIRDATPVPHNGPKAKKPRRV